MIKAIFQIAFPKQQLFVVSPFTLPQSPDLNTNEHKQNIAFQVSWIRRKDYHLLTVGLTTYSSDERFSAAHLKNSEVRTSKK